MSSQSEERIETKSIQDMINESVPYIVYEGTVARHERTIIGKLISGRKSDEIWAIMDEAMEALQVLNPRLYANIIRKIGR